ncbi:cytochrome P450 [Modestobacter versicolor]|uniref:Cytochrome P450 n=1 Tax=Modestobacter versicolor TaxID=429133 RepID=A0A323VB83_9ACTN|nr:cytochrome P450 [Modestobacter versicolor]MBB3674297.1 fatty-acid peroxygenase [Modestobacter versicolor]PZA22027.1 cytochrome P450 [Modestobacter versicolor]
MVRRPRLDQSIPMLAQGYAWLPDQRRTAGRATVHTRLMLARQTLGVEGPAGARFLYDEDHVRRSGALPEPVVSTLFGHGAVHTLDGEPHRVRKAMFVQLLMGEGIGDLVDRAEAAWDDAARRWAGERRIVLMDEAARVLTRAVCDWAAVPVTDEEVPALARDLTALVDGFATGAPRHWRARRVRQRREAWLAGIVEEVRSGARTVPAGSVLGVVSAHRDSEGELLEPRVAAVEVLNVVRPTVAVSWFVGFAAHALHRWPEHRERLRSGEPAFAAAFAHEVRRFYPFAPFIGGRAPREVQWDGEMVPAGSMVLLDLFGQNHDPDLFPEPYAFRPERFLTDGGSAGTSAVRQIGPWELVPQGAGDPRSGHRCPGEDVTVALLSALAVRLACLGYTVPEQDLTISLRRIPARPASRVVLSDVRPDGQR